MMLTMTKSRSSRAPHTPPISYPIPTIPSSSEETVISPALPPAKVHRGHSSSLSNAMHWLSRSSTQSLPFAPSKPNHIPHHISEPKLISPAELPSKLRGTILGSGAAIVRTPEDALRETGVRLTSDIQSQTGPRYRRDSSRSSTASRKEISRRHSSSLPPLPSPPDEDSVFLAAEPQVLKTLPPARTLLLPIPAPSVTPISSSRQSSMKSKSTPSNEDLSLPQVPSLPASISGTPTPPSFRPILTSDIPTGAIDHSKIIISLETCTMTYRTSLETLQSRPSYLSTFLASLLPISRRPSFASSVYSTDSDDISTYRNHLASQGLLPAASFSVSVFLDRPSPPYVHVLNYLRSPVASRGAPETLPRSIFQQASSYLRLEALVELRDEAAYLNLNGLHKLCIDEIRLRHVSRLHTRGQSTATVGSAHCLNASIYSLHTLLERGGSPPHRDSKSSDSKSSRDSPAESMTPQSPPTPESWNGGHRGRCCDPHPPPAGWI